MSNEQKNNEEEVDLSSLFVIIGKGFSKLFAFIGNIFKGIFDFLIQILFFFKENMIKIGLATLIGTISGGILDYQGDTIYESEMIVKPNFGSTKQLYTNIEYFNNLTGQEDKSKLVELFKLTEEEALSIQSFEIEPVISENDIVKSYDKVVTSIDTLSSKNYSYAQFKNSFTDVNYDMHIIRVKSTLNNIFNKFNNTILSGIANNKYFKTIQKVTIENIHRSDSIYRKNLIQVDSLRQLYAKVLLEESKQGKSETTINTGKGSEVSKPKEIELFNTTNVINDKLRFVNYEKSEKSKIINVVSSFQNIGSASGGILSNNFVKFAIIGFLLMTLFLLLIKLNKFLENYKN